MGRSFGKFINCKEKLWHLVIKQKSIENVSLNCKNVACYMLQNFQLENCFTIAVS